MVSRNVYNGFQSIDYLYRFNGKENDKDVKGSGDQIDYGARIYDPRLGRFLSVDPLTHDYPWYTPYQFAGNDVIRNIDLDGLEPKPATTGKEEEGQPQNTSETRYEFNANGGSGGIRNHLQIIRICKSL